MSRTPPRAARSPQPAAELGAINVGGYRVGVRRKTAKKVFDPSDNYTPTRKRGRPAGSGGGGGGSGGKKEAPQAGVCCLCNAPAAAAKDAARKLLQCRDCSNRAHPSCIVGNNTGKEKPPPNQWVCHGCKLCAFCFETSENEAMAVCVECGDAYHLTCHNPPITDEQWRNKWLCSSCDDIDKADTKPPDVQPLDMKLVEVKPVDIKSIDIKPADIKPVDINLVDVRPADIKSGDMKPVDVMPADVKPVDVVPDDIMPVVTPADIKPVDIQPVDVKQADVKPSTSKVSPFTYDRPLPPLSLKSQRLIEKDEFFRRYVPKEKTPDPTNWTVDQVCKYLQEHGCAAQAEAFRHHEIDGRSLLLLSRHDVLYELGIKLGPALKVNHFVQLLQKKDIRRVFPFNEMLY